LFKKPKSYVIFIIFLLIIQNTFHLSNIHTLLNIKGVNLNQFLELNNILLFLTFMYVKMYYFNTKHIVKNNNHVQLTYFCGWIA